MSRYDRSARPAFDRANLYDEITGKIIADLEAEQFPWVQPWGSSTAQAPLGLPKNASTGRAYSGINILILWGAVIQHGFPGQGWLTYRQAAALGGNVRKGERGTTVVYADLDAIFNHRRGAPGEKSRGRFFVSGEGRERHHPSSYFPCEPADAADDADLVGRALVGGIERVVGDNPHGRRVAVGDVLEALGHQAHAVVEDEDAWGAGELARHVDQNGIAVLQRGQLPWLPR